MSLSSLLRAEEAREVNGITRCEPVWPTVSPVLVSVSGLCVAVQCLGECWDTIKGPMCKNQLLIVSFLLHTAYGCLLINLLQCRKWTLYSWCYTELYPLLWKNMSTGIIWRKNAKCLIHAVPIRCYHKRHGFKSHWLQHVWRCWWERGA